MKLIWVILVACVVCAKAIPLPSAVKEAAESETSIQVDKVAEYAVDALLKPLANLALAAVANDERDTTTTAAIPDETQTELEAIVNSEGHEPESVELEITKYLVPEASSATEVVVSQDESTEISRRSVDQDETEDSATTAVPEVESVTLSARQEEATEVTTDIAAEQKSDVESEDSQPKLAEAAVADEEQPVTVIISSAESDEQVTVIINTDEQDGEVATHTLTVPRNQLENLSIVLNK